MFIIIPRTLRAVAEGFTQQGKQSPFSSFPSFLGNLRLTFKINCPKFLNTFKLLSHLFSMEAVLIPDAAMLYGEKINLSAF